MHVVLDDHLQAELRVPEHRHHEDQHQRRVERLRDQRACRGVIAVHQSQHDVQEPERKQQERHRGQALDDKVLDAVTGRPEADRGLQRRAKAAHATPPCMNTQIQTKAVSTTLPIVASQPLRTNCAIW